MRANDGTESLVFFSRLALYPIHWEAFEYICNKYQVIGTVITDTPPDLPDVHKQLGWVDPETQKYLQTDIRYMPGGNRWAKRRWLQHELRDIRPDAIWVQEEPTDYFLFQILQMYLFNRKPIIVTAVCENIFKPGFLPIRLLKSLLWSRLDGLLAVATPSIEGIRKAGMPKKVPAKTLVAGALSPPNNVIPATLPFNSSNDFIIGFVGRICEEKGWKILLKALMSLPENFKCIMAGDGPQLNELELWMKEPALQKRLFYAGLLPKNILWSYYKAFDCLIVPSLTFPHWKEQFGGVIADALAVGLPVIGSDSGSIPEVIGPAGLVVPEGDPDALASAISRMQKNYALKQKLGEAGKKRFTEEFNISAYARKIADALKLKEL